MTTEQIQMNEPLASPSKNESIKESGNLSMTNHIISANTNNIDHSIISYQSSQNTDCLNILKGTGTENDLIQNSPEKKKLKTDSSDQKEPSTNDNDNCDQINPDDQQLDDELKLDLTKVEATKTKTKSDREK